MKNTILIGLLFLSVFLQIPGSQAQISQGGNPRSFSKIAPYTSIPVLSPGRIDLEKLQEEDAQRRALGKEFDRRFGHNFYVNWNTSNSGIWTELPGGDRLWQLRISCPEALSVNLTFSQYKLPAGADLFIIGKKNVIGAFTSLNNQDDEKLGTGILGGDEVMVEYFEPAAARGKGKLEIGRVTHGYRNPFSTLGWGDSQFCEVNVNCPEGQPWQREKRAVAKIIDGGDHCTGALVNNVMMDGKPYFLTANHCFNNSSSTWVFAFNWEAPGCETPSVAFPETQTISGCTLRSRNAFSDFCLLELSSKPPASFNAYYCGWSAEEVPSQTSTMIHHPAGDIKKITFDYDPSVSSGYGVNAPNDNSHWRTMNYELSTTEGGSSGCPQFDQNHRIVGQLHGGPASCTNISSDFYGKFSKSWETGATAASRLKDWLDPNNAGITVLDGFDPACNKINVNLPWKKDLDTVSQALPHLWKIRNPDADSAFVLVSGGFSNLSGKAFRLNSENFNPAGRGDSLLVSPVGVSRYKNLKLHFHHAYRRKNTQVSDTLAVLVSRDCGFSFSRIGSFAGQALVSNSTTGSPSAFYPADTTEWIDHIIPLDSSFSRAEQLVIAFGMTSGNAGTLWLDEILVSGDTAKSLPVARFEASETGGCAGISIQFSDSSLNNPSSRTWFFEGGNPASSTDANPSVQYDNPGNFKVRLVVSNEEGSDTLEKESYILIQSIGTEETPFLQDYANITAAFPGTGYVLVNPQNNITWQRNSTVNAPGSQGGSLFFDNWSNPDVTGEKDLIVFPKILTAGKQHLKVRLKYAYKYYQNFGGAASPDTLRIGRASACGSQFSVFWKKGGQELATAGSATSTYTPAAGDWKTVSLNLDSLLIYPEVAIGFENTFGYGNRIFIDDISIDTSDNCPSAPMVQASSDSLCSGQTLILSIDSVANATYTWSGPGNYSSGSRVSTRVMNLNAAGTYQASVTVNGCTSEQSSINIAVSPQPAVPAITQTGNTLFGPPGLTYTWILNGDTLPDQTQSITAAVSGTYILVVQNAFGCSRNSQPKVVSVTGVNSLQAAQVDAYPNPAGDVLHLSVNGNSLSGFELRNSLGQLMLRQALQVGDHLYDLDMKGLAPGNYWLIIRTTNGIQRISVIKNP